MLAIQTMQRRLLRRAAASNNRHLHSHHIISGGVGGSGRHRPDVRRSGGAVENARPRSRRVDDIRHRHRHCHRPLLLRSFSSSSADEVVSIQEDHPSSSPPFPPPTITTTTTTTTTLPVSPVSASPKCTTTGTGDASSTATTESRRSTTTSTSTLRESNGTRRHPPPREEESRRDWPHHLPRDDATIDEVALAVDDFLMSISSPDLVGYLRNFRSSSLGEGGGGGGGGGMTTTMGEEEEENDDGGGGGTISSPEEEGEGTLMASDSERRRRPRLLADVSASQLHRALLKMMELCLPPTSSARATDGRRSHDDDREGGGDGGGGSRHYYSAAIVGRALRLSRRAEELGLPPHRPLYRRLAVGVVLTSSSSSSSSSSSCPAVVVEEGRLGEGGDRLIADPLLIELLGILEGARSALGIRPGGGLLRRLAEDVLAEPFLLLLETRRLEEAAGLLRGWKAALGSDANRHDLMSIIGEENALRALDLARGWIDDDDFVDRMQSNGDVAELAFMLQEALDGVLRDRRRRFDKISDLMLRLSLRDDDDDDDGDFDDGGDSDSDYEDDFDYESDGEEKITAYERDYESDGEEDFTSPVPVPAKFASAYDVSRGIETIRFASLGADDEDTTTISFRAETPNKSTHESEEGEDDESYTIIRGLTNKEARRSIYLRNSADWHLADIVPQLQDWNKGRMLTFTPMYERYVGNQIANAIDDEEDEEDYLG